MPLLVEGSRDERGAGSKDEGNRHRRMRGDRLRRMRMNGLKIQPVDYGQNSEDELAEGVGGIGVLDVASGSPGGDESAGVGAHASA